jgi:hypothetical protein
MSEIKATTPSRARSAWAEAIRRAQEIKAVKEANKVEQSSDPFRVSPRNNSGTNPDDQC